MNKAEREYGKKIGYTDEQLDKIDKDNKALLDEQNKEPLKIYNISVTNNGQNRQTIVTEKRK
jgi:hypothetical protein